MTCCFYNSLEYHDKIRCRFLSSLTSGIPFLTIFAPNLYTMDLWPQFGLNASIIPKNPKAGQIDSLNYTTNNKSEYIT